MKIIEKMLLTLLLSFLIAMATKAQQSITLEEVLGQVKSESFAANSAANERAIAQEGYKFYKSQLRPGINLNANIPNYSKTSAPVTQPDGSIAFQSIRQSSSSIGLSASQIISATGTTLFASSQINRFDDFSNEFTQFNGIPMRIGFTQPILGFNPWKYRKTIEPLLLAEAEKNYKVNIEESLTIATDLYFRILAAEQNLKIAEANQKVNERLLKITEERLALGKTSKDQKLQLEIELNQARLQVSQADFQRRQAIAILYTYLGKTAPEAVSCAPPATLAYGAIDIPELLSAHRANRPELIAYQREMAQADSRVAETKANFGPQAIIQASFGLARGSDNFNDIYTDPFSEQQANLSISLPILDWGRKRAAVTQQTIARENTQQLYEQQLLELENNVLQRAYAMMRLQNDLELLESMMEKAEERASISNERYVLGDIDITNLTIAQREKDQSKRNYINTLQSLWVTYYELRALTGYDIATSTTITY